MLGDEGFFDLLSRFQSNRMDDQRCSIQDKGSRLSLNSGPESPPRAIRKCKNSHSKVPQSPEYNFLFMLTENFSVVCLFWYFIDSLKLCSCIRVCQRLGRPRPAVRGLISSRRKPARPQAQSKQQPGRAQPPDGQR